MQDSSLCPRQYLHAPLLCRGALCYSHHIIYDLGPPPIFCENVENVESELNIPGKGGVIALEFITGSVRPVVNLSRFVSLGCTDDANLSF